MRRKSIVGSIAFASLALLHCGSSTTNNIIVAADGGTDADGSIVFSSGDAAVSVDTSGPVSCKSDADCSNGEGCIANVCGLPHCSEAASGNAAPLGKMYAIAPARQVVLANNTDPYAQTFDGAPLALVADAAFYPASAPSAMAAGRFGTTSATNAGLAVARASINGFTLISGPGEDAAGTGINAVLAFSPIAMAARDFDGDGNDEVVALGPGGELAVCFVASNNCTSTTLGGTGIDVSAGDALHDGIIRAVAYTTSASGTPTVTLWSPTLAGEPKQVGTISTALTHIALGDLDGDGHDEVIGLSDGGYFGTVDDSLHLYNITPTTIGDAMQVSVSGDSIDLEVGTFDGAKTAQISLLRSGSVVDLYTGANFGALAVTSSNTLAGVTNATMITTGDVRGQSALGLLEGDPTLVQGNPTPIFAAFYPPFSATESSGVSDVILTSTSTATDMTSQTLQVQATATVGYSAMIPVAAQASITASVQGTLAATAQNIDTISLAETFSLYANSTNPMDAAAVLVAGTCFRGFTYRVSDPATRLGAGVDGTSMVVLQPVGAERSVWSLTRYNAVASALGTLPALPSTDRIGTPSTYPIEAETFAGQPIATSDLVFPELDAYEVTDSARINLHLTLSDQRVNMLAATATATLSGSASVAGVMGSESLALSYNESETITLGTQTDIAMDVPQLRPGVTDGYAFTPVLYKEHYASMLGGTADSSLYVLNFTVGH